MILLLIGLIVGYYARQLYDKVVAIYNTQVEAREARKAGVVRPEVTKVTRGRASSDSEAGMVMRPTPEQVLAQKIKAERDMSV